MLVVDNASDDGSADAVEAWNAGPERPRRAAATAPRASGARARRRSTACCCARRGASSACCSTRTRSCAPGAVDALVEALRADPGAGAAGAQLVDPAGEPQPCAWRLPGPWRRARRARCSCTGGSWSRAAAWRPREVGWVQSAAMLVRREAAAEVGYLDPAFFVYSDETDFAKRLRDAGWRILHVPGGRRRPPRAARDRRRRRASGGSSSFTAGATATCASTTARRVALALRPLLGACPYARAGRSRRSCCPATTRGPLRPARAPGADARPRRGPARGRDGLQRGAVAASLNEPERRRTASPVARCSTASRSLFGNVNTYAGCVLSERPEPGRDQGARRRRTSRARAHAGPWSRRASPGPKSRSPESAWTPLKSTQSTVAVGAPSPKSKLGSAMKPASAQRELQDADREHPLLGQRPAAGRGRVEGAGCGAAARVCHRAPTS